MSDEGDSPDDKGNAGMLVKAKTLFTKDKKLLLKNLPPNTLEKVTKE